MKELASHFDAGAPEKKAVRDAVTGRDVRRPGAELIEPVGVNATLNIQPKDVVGTADVKVAVVVAGDRIAIGRRSCLRGGCRGLDARAYFGACLGRRRPLK